MTPSAQMTSRSAPDAAIMAPKMGSALRKLPVIETVLSSFRDIAANRQAAVRLSAAWAAILGAVGVASFTLIVGAQATLAASPWLTLATVYSPPIVFFLFILSVAVGWHRLVLLGEQPAPVYLRLDRQVWRYVGGLVVFSLIIWLVAIAAIIPAIPAFYFLIGTDPAQFTATGVALASVIGIALYVTLVLVASRIMIALPARAIGGSMKFREALAASKGNAWRILGGSLLISVPTIVLHALINLLLDFQVRMPSGDLNWVGIVSFLVLAAAALAGFIALTLVSTSFLSRAYSFLAKPAAAPAPAM